jgi:tRNA G18 (ribose-2'-O)-methylase SpoU
MKELPSYQIRQCARMECGLRYPLVVGHPFGERCPRCGASTRLISERAFERQPFHDDSLAGKLHLEALLDNIRSAWNVGSMFRTADGLGVRRLHLCGITPTPESPKLIKTSLGAEASIPWFHENNGLQVAQRLKAQGYQLWALEYNSRAESLLDISHLRSERPLLLVVGNEVTGVDPDIQELSDRTIYIPMLGEKRSFNAAVAFGIAVYHINLFSKSFPMDL